MKNLFGAILFAAIYNLTRASKNDDQAYQDMELLRQRDYMQTVDQKLPFSDIEVFNYIQMSSSYPNRKSDVIERKTTYYFINF